MILLSHPTGNANVRNVLKALSGDGMLSAFYTCVSWNGDTAIGRFIPRRLRDELLRRSFPEAGAAPVNMRPMLEAGRLLSQKLGLSFLCRTEKGVFSVDSVCRDLDRAVAESLGKIAGVKGVYAYEDCALASFSRAKDMGIKRIYDLPIGYWRAAREIYREESRREPEWAATLTGIFDNEEKLVRKDKELLLADMVVIPSTFVLKTLNTAGISPGKVKVIPFGSPAPAGEAIFMDRKEGKLKVLFAGALTQRKGLSYLLKAVSMVSGLVELTLVGRKPCEGCRPLDEAVKKYRWIPSLTHEGLLGEMRRHDVLVLPSLFEGFALVILEAMSQGLAVIITPNSGGADIVEDGKDGYVVPIRSVDSIAEKLSLLASDRELLYSVKQAAIWKATKVSWNEYRRNIVDTARGALGI